MTHKRILDLENLSAHWAELFPNLQTEVLVEDKYHVKFDGDSFLGKSLEFLALQPDEAFGVICRALTPLRLQLERPNDRVTYPSPGSQDPYDILHNEISYAQKLLEQRGSEPQSLRR